MLLNGELLSCVCCKISITNCVNSEILGLGHCISIAHYNSSSSGLKNPRNTKGRIDSKYVTNKIQYYVSTLGYAAGIMCIKIP